jgi:hypothetical protein
LKLDSSIEGVEEGTSKHHPEGERLKIKGGEKL